MIKHNWGGGLQNIKGKTWKICSVYKIIYNKTLGDKLKWLLPHLLCWEVLGQTINLIIIYKHVIIQHIYETIMFKN